MRMGRPLTALQRVRSLGHRGRAYAIDRLSVN
jgi:hypothetical protein